MIKLNQKIHKLLKLRLTRKTSTWNKIVIKLVLRLMRNNQLVVGVGLFSSRLREEL